MDGDYIAFCNYVSWFLGDVSQRLYRSILDADTKCLEALARRLYGRRELGGTELPSFI